MKKNARKRGSVVTVGTFDGVHRGHCEVIRELKEYAALQGLCPVVVTFDRHPLEVVAPARAPKLLQRREDRDVELRRLGVEVEEVAFTPALSHLTAGEWMDELRRRYAAEALVTGYDNKFGKDGHDLTSEDYRVLGERHGLSVLTARELPGVCSSAIRAALQDGEVARAAGMLGRNYILRGRVVEGRKLGRTIGFPTANVAVDPRMQLPGAGVYVARLDGRKAVVNIGTNPTVSEDNPLTVEAHIPDFEGDLYGKNVELEFVDRIRPERKFGSLEALRAQIAEDVAKMMDYKF